MKKISSFLVLFLIVILAFSNPKITSEKSQNGSDSLVAYFPFNGNANDESGNGHDGVVSGAALTTDRFGNTGRAYNFDGSSNFIEISNVSTLKLPEYTYIAWLFPTAYPAGTTIQTGSGTILDIGAFTADQFIGLVNYNPWYGIGGSGYLIGGESHDLRTGILPQLNQWYQVAVTRSSTTYTLFVNGVLVHAAPIPAAGPEYGNPSFGFIGKRIGDLQFFEGKLDDIRIYNRPLTDAELLHMYRNDSIGLTAYYPFNGNTDDESGNGHDGTVEGATLTQDRFGINGNALSFDGANDYITIADNPDLFSDEMTISWWYKLSEIPGGAAVVIGWVDGGHRYQQFFSGTQLNYFNGYNVGAPGMYFNPVIDLNDLNVWKNVVVTYKKLSLTTSETSIYVDGEWKQTDTHSLAMDYAPGINFLIGKNHNGNYFKGDFDDLRIFNRILGIGEITLLHNDSTTYFPTDTKLAAYFPFNGNANDESGNGYNGTVSGGVLTDDRNNNQNSAYTFPNVHDQIVLANTINLNLQGGFTLNAWVKYKSIGSSIVTKHNCWTPNGFVLQIDNGQIRLAISNGDWFFIRTNEEFVEDKWYMVTGVFDSVNGIGSVYIDGHLKASGSAVYNNFNTASITISEALNGCPYGNMPGAIDEVKIYNKPLTADEILAEYYASQTGLVAFYPFSGSANDASGNLNNGVVNKAVLTTDRYGKTDKSYLFNGIDSYIEGTNPGNNLPAGNSSCTFAAWVKDYSYYYWGCNIFHYGTAQSAPTNFHFLITDVLGLGNGYGYGVAYGKTNLIDSTWHFVCGTYSNGDQNVKLYVDGKPDNSSVLPTAPNTVLSTNWRIGLFMGGGTPFNGKLDEIRVYNTHLTDQEIQDMYLNETTAPTLEKPVNMEVNITMTPTLQWSSSFENAKFHFQLADDLLFTSILLDDSTTNQETLISGGLLADGIVYYWRVRTTLNGETGPWSDVWKFSTLNTGLNQKHQLTDLLSITPNPAGALVQISFTVAGNSPGRALVNLEIFNSLGLGSLKILEKKMAPGAYNITFDTENLKTGIYYCRLKTDNQMVVQKLIITR
ncbi:MAG: LamG-like jellyroll fold domain-containing protein [Bacteroidales bacterium]|nr:LamG-like jellyroll fold domain-containing protein [Bacteroidales bacterium]